MQGINRGLSAKIRKNRRRHGGLRREGEHGEETAKKTRGAEASEQITGQGRAQEKALL